MFKHFLKKVKCLLFTHLVFLAFVLDFSCSNTDLSFNGQKTISVVNWNVQTFFDANTDGFEYADFIKSKTWNETAYEKRVERLCNVLSELDADVYVLEEIENDGVIFDICNGLAGCRWNSGAVWNYACFYKEDGSSIGCAVISKFEIVGYTNHNVDVNSFTGGDASLRAIGKVVLDVHGEQLVLLVNHWKSKKNDDGFSKILREKQESVLANLIFEQGKNSRVLACGDFNKDIREFEFFDDEEYNITLKGIFPNVSVNVYCPWFDENGELDYENGSYFYANAWQKIDSFFIYGNLAVLDFEVCVSDLWTKQDKTPYAFRLYNCEGYSDHLPIKILLKL